MSKDISELNILDSILASFNSVIKKILFFDVGFGFPFLIACFIFGAVFVTIYLSFINLTLFRHAIDVVKGKYSRDTDLGRVTHTEAIYTAALSTVGLGSVAGVAIGMAIGGPGVVLWMLVAGFFCASVKFTEIFMGVKYRTIGEDGEILGGPFHYIKHSLAEKNMNVLGYILGLFYAVSLFGSALGAANMFQSNQTVEVLMANFEFLDGQKHLIGLAIVLLVGSVIVGGAKALARVASAIVPFTTVFYLSSVLIIIIFNITKLPGVCLLIISEAFNPNAMSGGVVGVISIAFARIVFSTEAGGGTSAIAHSMVKTSEPVRAACAGLIEILFALSVCMLTGIAITITGVYEGAGTGEGISVTSKAFANVHVLFPKVLALCVPFLSITTIIAWGYYGSRSWCFIFGNRGVNLFRAIFLGATYYGAIVEDTGIIIEFCDYMWMMSTFPNLIVLFMALPHIKSEIKKYKAKLRNGEFDIV